MTTAFAALETRLNTTVLARLSNAVVVLSGNTLDGIFVAPYSSANVGPYGMASSAPAVTVPSSAITSDPVGSTVTINGTSYKVVAPEPDGSGLTTLILERTA